MALAAPQGLLLPPLHLPLPPSRLYTEDDDPLTTQPSMPFGGRRSGSSVGTFTNWRSGLFHTLDSMLIRAVWVSKGNCCSVCGSSIVPEICRSPTIHVSERLVGRSVQSGAPLLTTYEILLTVLDTRLGLRGDCRGVGGRGGTPSTRRPPCSQDSGLVKRANNPHSRCFHDVVVAIVQEVETVVSPARHNRAHHNEHE